MLGENTPPPEILKILKMQKGFCIVCDPKVDQRYQNPQEPFVHLVPQRAAHQSRFYARASFCGSQHLCVFYNSLWLKKKIN